MPTLSLDLRRRIVEAYLSKNSGTYEQTARLFGIGEATVSRLLRRKRETGDVVSMPKGGNNPRRVDLNWLRKDLQANPDARLGDRAAAWESHSHKGVSVTAMWFAVQACEWTHKKRHPSPENKTARR
jgi:transposase